MSRGPSPLAFSGQANTASSIRDIKNLFLLYVWANGRIPLRGFELLSDFPPGPAQEFVGRLDLDAKGSSEAFAFQVLFKA
jgi:hypothetical protein